MCVPRPRIDYSFENSQLGEGELDHNELMEKFVDGFDGEVKNDTMYQPAMEVGRSDENLEDFYQLQVISEILRP
jgi:hypothetical protein